MAPNGLNQKWLRKQTKKHHILKKDNFQFFSLTGANCYVQLRTPWHPDR